MTTSKGADMGEMVTVDKHGCVWADGSLLLCPAEQADRGPCECSPTGGKPATALMLAAAISAAVKACTDRVRTVTTALSPTRAEVYMTRPGHPAARVFVDWDPETMLRPVTEVSEHYSGCRFTAPLFVTDALWQAASRSLLALRRGDESPLVVHV